MRFITTPEFPELPKQLLPQGTVICSREPELEDAFMWFLHQAQQATHGEKNDQIRVIDNTPNR
ncbi:Uncharacterised protein [Acinetobacter haemolyticus]|nr:Uncharacterised protein [Acinetobacter haemolyticus]